MKFEDANDLLKPGYLPFKTGYQEIEDGKWVVAGLTRMPGYRAKMVDWWFSWRGMMISTITRAKPQVQDAQPRPNEETSIG